MHNMEEDCLFGTCLMQNRRYVTLSWQHLDKAFRKVLEYDYVISPAMEKQLQDLYNDAMADVIALEHQIEISQCAYKQMQADATLAREAKRAARNSTSKANVPTTAPTMKRVTKERPKITIFGTQEDCAKLDMAATHPIHEKEIASDNADFPPPLATQEEVVKVQAPRQQFESEEHIAAKGIECEEQKAQGGTTAHVIEESEPGLNQAPLNAPQDEAHITAEVANPKFLEATVPGPYIDEQRNNNEPVLLGTGVAKQRSEGEEHKGIECEEQKAQGGTTAHGIEESEPGANQAALKAPQDEESVGTSASGVSSDSGISVQLHMPLPLGKLNKINDTAESLIGVQPRRSLLNLHTNILLRNGKPVNGPPRTIHEIHDAEAQLLLPKHLVLHNILRDGNCLFRALLACAGRQDISHWDLRKEIVDHVVSMWEDSQVTYATWIRYEYPTETPDTYKARLLGRTKDWGNFAEIVATSIVLERDIVIHAFTPGGLTLTTTPISTNDVGHRPNEEIHLLRVNQSHYHALIPTSNVVHAQPPPPNSPPKDLLPESDSQARKRLAAFINSYPEKQLSKNPDDQQSGLKRKREEDPRHKQTFVDNRKRPDDDDFVSGNEGISEDDDRMKGDPQAFTIKDEKSSGAVKVKRDRTVRRQDRSNRSEKNWTTAMKRHWNTKQKNKAMALITIKRDKLEEVQLHA